MWLRTLNLKSKGKSQWNYSPLTFGVYLADVEDDQGPSSVIPGSHNGDLFNQYDAEGKWTGCLQDEDLWRVDLDSAKYLTGPMGSVTIHNCRTIHGSKKNLRATDGKSWQAYSVTRWYDDILIGQYPTGSLFTYNNEGLKPFEPPLPVPENASPSAREAQTIAIYGGDLYVGVWPWGELWRLDGNTEEWKFVDRVFHSPEVSKVEAPYIGEMEGKEGDSNYWGQRISSLVPFNDALYIGTLNKQGKPFVPESHQFLSPEVVEQYGMVHRMTGVAHAARQFEWKPVTELRFVYDHEGLKVYQDGELLVSREVSEPTGLEGRQAREIRTGMGIYGPFAGKIVSHESQSSRKKL
jgi:hypothetical protein